MGLLTGSLSVTRFNIARPEEVDFEAVAFREIAPDSEVRESVGIVPYEPGAPYEVGAGRWAFRVRVDKRRPDPTLVRERLKELVRAEMEMTGAPHVGAKKRKELRFIAEEELLVREAPRSKIIECAMDGPSLYVGSTANAFVGLVILLLRKVGVEAQPRTPWLEAGLPELYSDVVETKTDAESVYGCRFLRALVGDPDFLVEPEAGNVKLATREARITLTGEVLGDLHRYLDRGAEVLAAKLLAGEVSFTFDALAYRLSSVRLPPVNTDHWTHDLDDRLERIGRLFELLDEKFAALMMEKGGGAPSGEASRPPEPAG